MFSSRSLRHAHLWQLAGNYYQTLKLGLLGKWNHKYLDHRIMYKKSRNQPEVIAQSVFVSSVMCSLKVIILECSPTGWAGRPVGPRPIPGCVNSPFRH